MNWVSPGKLAFATETERRPLLVLCLALVKFLRGILEAQY